MHSHRCHRGQRRVASFDPRALAVHGQLPDSDGATQVQEPSARASPRAPTTAPRDWPFCAWHGGMPRGVRPAAVAVAVAGLHLHACAVHARRPCLPNPCERIRARSRFLGATSGPSRWVRTGTPAPGSGRSARPSRPSCGSASSPSSCAGRRGTCFPRPAAAAAAMQPQVGRSRVGALAGCSAMCGHGLVCLVGMCAGRQAGGQAPMPCGSCGSGTCMVSM